MPTSPKVIGADDLAQWSRYAAMLRDYHHGGPGKGDGVLERNELESYIATLKNEREARVRARESTVTIDHRLTESKEMLRDMLEAGVEGLSYLPPDIRDAGLPENLVKRVTEMMMLDDKDGLGEVTQEILDSARARYHDTPARFGRQKEVALEELGQIAERLGLH